MRRYLTKSSNNLEQLDADWRTVQMRQLIHLAVTVVLVSALTGCGDGSSDDDTYTSTDDSTTYSIGGTVSGLPAGQQIVMDDGDGGSHPLTYNGKYTFDVTGGWVTLSISKQPSGALCSLNITSNNADELAFDSVNFQITCVPNS